MPVPRESSLPALTTEAVILFLELLLLNEEFLPAFFECARHQTVFRINRLVPPLRQLRVVTRPLAPLLPVFFESLAFLLNVRLSSHAQFDGGGFERSQDLLSDQIIHNSRCHPWTVWLPGCECMVVAIVLSLAMGVIESPHPPTAMGTDDQPRKQRDT